MGWRSILRAVLSRRCRGYQWEQREHITEFLRRVRQETLEVEQKAGTTGILLAARIPDNLIGCHFDGLNVETWVRVSISLTFWFWVCVRMNWLSISFAAIIGRQAYSDFRDA